MLDIKKFHNKMLGQDVEAVKVTASLDTIEEMIEWVNHKGGGASLSWDLNNKDAVGLHTRAGWTLVLIGEWIIWSETEGFSGESQSIIDVIFEPVVDQTNAWVELIARICHEANRVLQVHAGDIISTNWENAPSWQKDSAIDGVLHALEGKSSEELHKSWCDFKIKDGWMYGANKDEVAKTHPGLVPYDELPADQKLKDHIFGSIVKSFKDAALV